MNLLIFHFPADVWGTVSDWIMIFVTSVTAIFLYKTLQSQKEVQLAQNDLLKIEQYRLRESKKPILKYFRMFGFVPANLSHDFISISISNESQNPALNVKITLHKNQVADINFYGDVPQHLIPNGGNLVPNFYIKSLENQIPFRVDFTVTYEDEIGTKYKQESYFNCRFKDFFEMNNSLPEIIK
jgi:hypothetical protein